jgi:dTDP-L-rhamnose 4-epimerase
VPRLLITGGAGFIGSHIVEHALNKGWAVRVVDSLRADVHPPGPSGLLDKYPEIEFVQADLTGTGVAAAVVERVDAVCHQAAKVGLGINFADAPDYVHSNQTATAMLLAAMTEASVSTLVLASSMVVYGEGWYRDSAVPDAPAIQPPPRLVDDLRRRIFDPLSPVTGEPLVPELVREDARLDPRNVYAATKLGQEFLASAWARSTGGRVAALRYHNVYGPGMPQGTPYAGVASLFRSALERGEAPRVFEDGGQRRDFVHVSDVAAANLAALDWAGGTSAGGVRAFNVGSGVVHTVGEFATQLSEAMGGPSPVVTGEYRLGDVRHITASSERAHVELGWRAQVDFLAGVREFANARLRLTAGP